MSRTFHFPTTVGNRDSEVIVTYTCTPFLEATREQPAEGGEVEVTRIENADTKKAVFLSQDEEDAVLEEAIGRSREDWADRIDEEADYKYEQYRDRMLEDREDSE